MISARQTITAIMDQNKDELRCVILTENKSL